MLLNYRLYIFILCYFITFCHSAVQYLKNVDCNSYVDYVQTDPLNYFRYNPFYIRLHRCHGADSIVNPRNKQCIPTATGVKDLDIYVINNSNGTYEVMRVQNHTDCIEVCTLDKSACSPYQTFSKEECVCMCRYDKTPNPDPCSDPFYWDQSMCNCICKLDSMNCPKKKEFSKDECGCVCKQKFHVRCAKRKMVVDEETCGCVEPIVMTGQSIGGSCTGEIKVVMLILALGIEAIVIILMYFVLYKYCYKVVYFRRKSDKERESISKYEEYTADKVEPPHTSMDYEEEVPPFSLNSLNRNSLNRNSINRNSINRNSINRNSINRSSLNKNSLRRNTDLDKIYNNNSLYHTKLAENYEPSEGNVSNEPYTSNFYPLDERSLLNDPSDGDVLLYNDIEPSNGGSDISSDYYKNISLV